MKSEKDVETLLTAYEAIYNELMATEHLYEGDELEAHESVVLVTLGQMGVLRFILEKEPLKAENLN